MITFHEIRYKNLMSTGNVWSEIRLDEHRTNLLIGENGSGKSTILEALCFALYGKPFRKINKPQLVNSINKKELEVEVTFTIKKSEYKIRRGIKPNFFEIWKDNVLLNQDAATRDYQQYLENNILKLNYKSFGQIVVLGNSTFVPFMQLTPQARREIIEDLLDLQIFTTMNLLLKEKIGVSKEQLTKNKYNIKLAEDRLETAKKHNKALIELQSSTVEKLETKYKEYEIQLSLVKDILGSLEASIRQFQSQLVGKARLDQKIEECKTIGRQLESKMKLLELEKKFYEENSSCPKCLQNISHEHKGISIETLEAQIKDLNENSDKLGVMLTKYLHQQSIMDEIQKNMNKVLTEKQECLGDIRFIESTLSDLKIELTSAKKNVIHEFGSDLTQLSTELSSLKTKQKLVLEDQELYSLGLVLLKDGGIKTKIVRQYVPIMNKLINKYLSMMDFFVDFQLDETFNETIKSRFRDIFTYSSFSEGEKLRIDLALLFTWRTISKMRNSVSTNILIMDEILDSSLDAAGTDEFLRIINDLAQDSNIFIISHKGDQVIDKFDNVLKFEKVKNFSRIVNE